MDTKNRGGRPTTKRALPGDRVSLGFRVTYEVKQALAAVSEASGRSISSEAEYRLERSLQADPIIEELAALRRAVERLYEDR